METGRYTGSPPSISIHLSCDALREFTGFCVLTWAELKKKLLKSDTKTYGLV